MIPNTDLLMPPLGERHLHDRLPTPVWDAPRRPSFYIAAPFFNQPQMSIVLAIEAMLVAGGFEFYSPRMVTVPPDKRGDWDAWTPIAQRNIDALHERDILLAVTEWAMPEDTKLGIMKRMGKGETYISPTPNVFLSTDKSEQLGGIGMYHPHRFLTVEFPDSGVMAEIGGMRLLQKPVVAFRREAPEPPVNLMLSHFADAMVLGFAELAKFLYSGSAQYDQPGSPDTWFDWDQWHPRRVISEII